ncbi:hypothetical protein CBR_g28764 [Chara braunii]|uniref:DUF659 domain-containing protein n=1 Tax=Chara braunii TaxID=69332 RepID=A0A388L9R1_CHABU|nr:hypothetical protein CBR_g28764 [Chara braunii]|eukprot:GBG79050.1 hypothetical protein CBR_g28764 [Chara braunii]
MYFGREQEGEEEYEDSKHEKRATEDGDDDGDCDTQDMMRGEKAVDEDSTPDNDDDDDDYGADIGTSLDGGLMTIGHLSNSFLQWWYVSDIPSEAARRLEYHRMRKKLLECPPYTHPALPMHHVISCDGIPEQQEVLADMVAVVRKDIVATGATILTDGRKSITSDQIVNFLVAGPTGDYLFRTVQRDCAVQETTKAVVERWKDVFDNFGVENVNVIYTDSASTYVAASKLLTKEEVKYNRITWLPCEVHVYNLLLSDILKDGSNGKLGKRKDTIIRARAVVRLIREHGVALSLYGRFSVDHPSSASAAAASSSDAPPTSQRRGKELVYPAQTRFAMHYLMLERVARARLNRTSMDELNIIVQACQVRVDRLAEFHSREGDWTYGGVEGNKDAASCRGEKETSQREIDLAFVYQHHIFHHGMFRTEDARNHGESCGLPAYWFHDMPKLLHIVRLKLPSLKAKRRQSTRESQGPDWRGQITMAVVLEALDDLSRLTNSDVWDEMADVVLDIPQATRFSMDVDVGRDFASSGGYSVLLSVLQCYTNAVDAEGVQLAASILERLARGLAVLPWQPWRDQSDADADILLDSDVAGELGEKLVHLLDPRAGNPGTEATTVAAEEEREQEEEGEEGEEEGGKLRLQETVLSALCSFAHAASEVHAHIGWLGKEAAKASRFCNAFTTVGPGDWPLETPVPNFGGQEARDFTERIRAVLICPRTMRHLLEFLKERKRKPSSPKLVEDAIRIFAYLLCPRMVYWHRFDMRLQDFPDSLCSLDSLPQASKVEAALKGLICHCCEKGDEARLSAFSKLYLVKIFICQNLRDIDCQVAELLLQCLVYCDGVRGRREIDWFTREVMDTLRDLLASCSPSQKRTICNYTICRRDKGWGWKFLVRIRDYKFQNDLSGALVCKRDVAAWILDEQSFSIDYRGTPFAFQNCYASAVGLAADVLDNLAEDLPDMVDSGDDQSPVHYISRESRVRREALDFCRVLLCRLRLERVRSGDSFLRKCWAIFLLRITEPFINLGWRPACTVKEIFCNKWHEAEMDGMEGLEDSVHTLLLIRNVTRVLRICVCRGEKEREQEVLGHGDGLLTILEQLLLLLRYPLDSFKLPTQLGLDALSVRCVSEMRSDSAVVIAKLLRFVVRDHEANLKPFLRSYWARLKKWKQKSEPAGGPDSTSRFQELGGSFWERIWKTQREFHLGLVYQLHYRDHPSFGSDDAKNNPERCGLPAYWFHDVDSLLKMVRANLPTLSVKGRESSPENSVRESRGRLRTALEAILELSESTNRDVRDEMADIVQDIPQGSRFSINVDAVRDIARSGWYPVLLSVLQCTTNPTGAKEVRLAAAILAGLASGLAVLPWQPWRDVGDADQQSTLFNPLAGELVAELVHLVDRCTGHQCTRANTVGGEEAREQEDGDGEGEAEEGQVCLQETALSALCSFGQAASEMHAHIAWVAKEAAVPSSRFCNAFSTLGPGDWPLETPIPSFDRQEVRDFIASVVAELSCPRTERFLLEFLEVGKLKQSFQKLVADSIRILAYLLCPRMVY